MSTFAEDVEEVAKGLGEDLLHVVIGTGGWGSYGMENKPKVKKNKVQTWVEARESLNYEYDSGYGAPDCHAIYAYTKHYVIGVTQYDGSTGFFTVPRKPRPEAPEMPGG